MLLLQLSPDMLQSWAKASGLEKTGALRKNDLCKLLAEALSTNANQLTEALVDLLNMKTVSELRVFANKHKLEGYSRSSKKQLASILVEKLPVSDILDTIYLSFEPPSPVQQPSTHFWQNLDTWQKVVAILVGVVGVLVALWSLFSNITGYYDGPSPYSKTATAAAQVEIEEEQASKYLPWLSDGYLIISKTHNWDPMVDRAFEGANQLIDVPLEVRTRFENYSDSYYVWLLTENKNPIKESCGREISIWGPIFYLTNRDTINPNPDDLLANIQQVVPSAIVIIELSANDTMVISLEGQLLADSPAQSSILLFFYPQARLGTGTLCSGQRLGVPVAAFRYTAEDGLSPEDYFVQQINLGGIEIFWSMLATVGSSREEQKEFVVSFSTWFPYERVVPPGP